MRSDIKEQARGRWRNILPALGIGAQYLTGRHMGCPICGGKDRFRWDNREGSGGYFCSQCGPGSGFDLVMKVRRIGFSEARKLVEAELPNAAITVMPAAGRKTTRNFGMECWQAGLPLNEYDAAVRYLDRRALTFPKGFPTELRFRAGAIYYDDNKVRSQHPALVARYAAPDGKSYPSHVTYLSPDGEKAKVATVRKFAPGPIPAGGAVRLWPTNGGTTLGVGEGLETCLAAAQIYELPVWATLTAINLQKWIAPPHVKNVVVFADNDESFTGQLAAYSLATRLKAEGFSVEVRLPDVLGTDWNDHVSRPREHASA